MKLAVCLISADRFEYTKRTVESFFDHNFKDVLASRDLMLLHADDGSKDARIRSLAKLAGFELCAGTQYGKQRRGGQAMRHDAINFAAKRGATHVLILENDWESVRPLPWDTLDYAFALPNVYCMRLYGRYRERDPITGEGRRACGKTHYGKGKGTYDPNWVTFNPTPAGVRGEIRLPETIEVGDIHWGAPPTVTRIKEAVWLHDGTRSESAIRKKCKNMQELTARVVENVFWHIGDDRTPEFKQ